MQRMLKIFSNLFDSNAKIIDRYQKMVSQINVLEPDLESLSDKDLKNKTQEFRDRLAQGTTLDQLLPEAFAVVREASKRTLGLRHFDVQLMAGIGFHEGKVSEQKTGEGKTLSATSALYLNALAGKGAHLVTVNDYLARRDAGWMGPIFHALDMSVGVIYSGQGDLPALLYDPDHASSEHGDERLDSLRPISRREAYQADITYGTNNEFGFDYLRDNMVQSMDRMVQREHFFAIVDEVDSILIDEARTPLIISAPDTDPTKKYTEFAKLVETLTKDIDYSIDEKQRTATLTDYGIRRLEKRMNVDNLYEKDYQTIHLVESALKANAIFQRDKDYVVKDGQVIIVDEHTGRLMFGRRYSDGLHQAIEAKEGATIQQESRTLATISLQNYFRMYAKLAGMTGTALTEAEEFRSIYNMDVVVVPTNRDITRLDHPDLVYKSQRAKFGAIVKTIKELNEKGQPILIGTRSIDQNDIMSRYLKRVKVPHQVLNAKNHEREAMILAEAGKPGGVTVATNIAGRGVDIVLGGSAPDKPGSKADKKAKEAYKAELKEWQKRHQQVLDAGGLFVLGVERHDSRRIDNQLRGRSGRQGDPGASRFFVSLEDDLMRIFGGEQVSKLMDFLKIPEDQPIESGMVSKSLEQAQSKVEAFHFDQRKHVVEYDDVMNRQREIIYKRRRLILEEAEASLKNPDEASKLKDRIFEAIDNEIAAIVTPPMGPVYERDQLFAITKEFLNIIPFDKNSQEHLIKELAAIGDQAGIQEKLSQVVTATYNQREEQFGRPTMNQIERYVTLSTIDQAWMDHLDAIDDLREGIWMRGGKDQVLTAYKKEAFDMFERLLSGVDSAVARTVFRLQPTEMSTQPVIPENVITGKQEEFAAPAATEPALGSALSGSPAPAAASSQGIGALAAALSKTSSYSGSSDGRSPMMVKVVSGQAKIGRNDPCPCGSGLKYKKCGMINSPDHKG
jgi:preprotein translocase subunit SecA